MVEEKKKERKEKEKRMGKRTDYKKTSSWECAFCDYSWKCRKGHKCGVYKKAVKKKQEIQGKRANFSELYWRGDFA